MHEPRTLVSTMVLALLLDLLETDSKQRIVPGTRRLVITGKVSASAQNFSILIDECLLKATT
jgi:hypothetical protein